MKKQIFTLGLLAVSTFAFAQVGAGKAVSDTIRVQEIEDVQLHKTGNPNKAKPLSSKANLTMMETPQPISIVTHEIIEQQQAKQLSDVLQNVNGIYITSSRGGSQDSFGGRGFALGNDNILKNGVRVNSGVFPEVSGLERVEVLKGANAMQFGNTAAGGIINMITKKPRFNFGGSASFSVGSWNTYKPTVDIYGPLSKNAAFRVNGAFETAESFRDVVSSKKYYFNPSFLFNLGEKTQLIIEGDYLKNDFTPDFGVGSITAADKKSYSLNTNVPRNAFFGVDWQNQDVQQASTDVILNHQINSKWVLNAVASYQNYTKDYFSSERVQWLTNNQGRITWTRPFNKTYNEQNYGSAQVNLNGEFNTGKIGHKVLVGADADYGQSDAYAYKLTNVPNNVLYLDDPSTWSASGIAKPDSQLSTNNRSRTRRIGVYAQDFISISNQFKVIAGLRWSYIENMPTIKTDFIGNEGKTFVKNSSTSDQAFSPKIGVVYMPNNNLSVFATYTNSFAANNGMTVYGESLNPTTIDQFEIGGKKNLWNNAVAVNLSLYQINYQNYYQTAQFLADGVTANNDSTYKEYIGKMQSRGVELDITGNPTTQLSIIGGFSYNNSIYKDTPEALGYVENQRIVRTPATTANVSVFYTFANYVKGFKLGAGVYYVGDRYAGWNDTKTGSNSLEARDGVSRMFKVDPYTTVSLSAGYDWKKFSLQAKVNNLFDVVNYNVHENYSVNPIAPRNFYFTLTYKL